MEEPLLQELSFDPSPIMRGLVSCVGSDYCHFALIETKGWAIKVARELEERTRGHKIAPLTIHWSGCPAGCGNHLVADIGLLGKKAKVDGQVVDAVDVFVGGRSGPDAKHAVKIMEDVPCDKLASVLEGLTPYHSRDKLHRTGRGKAATRPQETLPKS